MRKKIYVITLACMLCITCAVPAFAADETWYTDVPKTHWAYEKIKFATDQNIITGYPGNIFKPEGMVTCEEAISMLYFTLASVGELKDEEDHSEAYKEVLDQAKISTWSRKVVSYALTHGIIKASEVNTFVRSNGAGRPALREETAVWSAKAIANPLAPAYMLGYLDSDSISAAAVPYVDLLYRLKVMTGDNKNQFLPKNNVKRCEFASVCMSVYESRQQTRFVATRDVVNVSGVVTAVSASEGKLAFKNANGTIQYITMPDRPEAFYDIKTGNTIVIGYYTFDAACGINLQILGKDPSAYILDCRVNEIETLQSSDGKIYYSVRLTDNTGKSIIYLIDSKTSIFDSEGNTRSVGSLVLGDDVKVICDGIKILELKVE